MKTAEPHWEFTEALRHAFHIHQLGHAHWSATDDDKTPVSKPPEVDDWRTAGPPTPSRRGMP